jgi:hypothetical protein
MLLCPRMPAQLPAKTDIPLTRLPPYRRVDDPPPMKLTDRDRRLLETIHAYDGLLSPNQIKTLFFTGTSQLKQRLTKLYQHGYLARPNRKQRAMLDTSVYWLDSKGAELVAGLAGERLDTFSYRREPRWLQVPHDLAVNDVRIAVTRACEQLPDFNLEEWIPEGDFHAYPDKVDYTLPNGKRGQRHVMPDGYFHLTYKGRSFRFLLELDNGTADTPKFAREKVIPNLAYLKTALYKQRFGANTGQWLIVTTSPRRLKHLKAQTERTAGESANAFYFTTQDAITDTTVLTAPIWCRGGTDETMPLLKP